MIWIAAPRTRIGPRSRLWVIVLFVRAAMSQPRKVVPYLVCQLGIAGFLFLSPFQARLGTYRIDTMSVPMLYVRST